VIFSLVFSRLPLAGEGSGERARRFNCGRRILSGLPSPPKPSPAPGERRANRQHLSPSQAI